jgi:hypothetical protein
MGDLSMPTKTIDTLSISSQVSVGQDAEKILAEHTTAIRTSHKRVIAEVVEIGRRLTECREIVGHGRWLSWLDAEFGWTDQTARNYMRVYEMSKTKNFLNSTLSISVVYQIAAPNTPEPARNEILDRANAGENISVQDAMETIAAAKESEAEETDEEDEAEDEDEEAPTLSDQCTDILDRLQILVMEQEENSPILQRLLTSLTEVEAAFKAEIAIGVQQ